jgi:hypothetical protein
MRQRRQDRTRQPQEPDNHKTTSRQDNHKTRQDNHKTRQDNHKTKQDNQKARQDNHKKIQDYHKTKQDNHKTTTRQDKTYEELIDTTDKMRSEDKAFPLLLLLLSRGASFFFRVSCFVSLEPNPTLTLTLTLTLILIPSTLGH